MPYSHEQQFNDWGKFLDHVENTPIHFPVTARAESCRSRSKGYASKSFSGTDTWSEAMDLAHNGWKEGVTAINDLSTFLFQSIAKYAHKPEPFYAFEGTNLDIGRWHDGEPEHWLSLGESDAAVINGKTVAKLCANLCCSAGVSTDTIIARGACLTALARVLDYMDIRTEIHIVACLSTGWRQEGDIAFLQLIAKHPNQDFDLDRLAFALTHPSMFRRLVFSHFETMPEDKLNLHKVYPGSSYGYPSDILPETHEKEKYDVYLGDAKWGDVQWSTPRKAQEWIVAELNKLGVEISLPPEVKPERTPRPVRSLLVYQKTSMEITPHM